jgi:hypothetical protein
MSTAYVQAHATAEEEEEEDTGAIIEILMSLCHPPAS